ncbi:PepSY domain-containing protein [Aliikangiella sp. IMCC44632]
MKKNISKYHKILGIVMLLPFLGWAVTGVFFFIKPGYSEAYQSLSVKFYPLKNIPKLTLKQDVIEFRQVKTLLGIHHIYKTKDGWSNWLVKEQNGELIETNRPKLEQAKKIIVDAIKQNPIRYGSLVKIQSVENAENQFNATTSTNVTIAFNWDNLSLRQKGADTRFINQIYDIHYLRWTGIRWFDDILGLVGLGLVVLLAVLGLYLSFSTKPKGR